MLEILIAGTLAQKAPTSTISKYDSGAENMAIVTTEGNLYFYGKNDNGTMGRGDTVSPTGWYKSTMTGVSDVWQNGSYLTVIRKTDGSVWYCGKLGNRYQMGVDYGTSNTIVPTWQNITSGLPVGSSEIKYLKTSTSSTLLLTNSGVIYWCGVNTSSHFGKGNTTDLTTFTSVSTTFTIKDAYVCPEVTSSLQTSLLIDTSDYLWGAGANNYKLVSSSTTVTTYSTYTQVSSTYTFSKIVLGSQQLLGLATTVSTGARVVRYSGYPAVYGSGSTTVQFLIATASEGSTQTIIDSTLTSNTGSPSIGALAYGRVLSSSGVVSVYTAGSMSTDLRNVTNTASGGTAAMKPFPPGSESSTNSSFEFLRFAPGSLATLYNDANGYRLYGLGPVFGQTTQDNAPFVSIAWPIGTTSSSQVQKVVSSGSSGNEALGVLMTNGNFYTRGRATNGKLGNGGVSDSYSVYDKWYLVATGVVNIFGGGNTFLVIHGSSVPVASRYRQIGSQAPFGTSADSVNITSLPSVVSSTIDLTTVVDICMSAESIMYLTSAGVLWMSGVNTSGSAGTATTNITTPIQVATGVRSIAMAAATAYYVTNDNKLYCSGDNTYNQLGDGTTTARNSFAELLINGTSGIVQDVNAGLTGAHILTTDGKVYGVGAYIYGQGSARLTTPTLVTLPDSSNGYTIDLQSLGNTASAVTNGDKTAYYGRASLGVYYGLPASSSDAYVQFGTEFDHTKTTGFVQLSNSSWFLNDGKLYHAGTQTITDTYNSTVIDSAYTLVDNP